LNFRAWRAFGGFDVLPWTSERSSSKKARSLIRQIIVILESGVKWPASTSEKSNQHQIDT
jgi:hypothetical protein